jgi:hypothetical protein
MPSHGIRSGLPMSTKSAPLCCCFALTIRFSAVRTRDSPRMSEDRAAASWPGATQHADVRLPATSRLECAKPDIECRAFQEQCQISGQDRRSSGLPSKGNAAHDLSMQNCIQPRGLTRMPSVELAAQASGGKAMGFWKPTMHSSQGGTAADEAAAWRQQQSTESTEEASCDVGSLLDTASIISPFETISRKVSEIIAARWGVQAHNIGPQQALAVGWSSGRIEELRPEPAPPRPAGGPRVRFWRRQPARGARRLPDALLRVLPEQRRDAALSHTWTCSQAARGSRWSCNHEQ